MCTQKERTLRCVLSDLAPEWEQDLNTLKEKLEKEGVTCGQLTEMIWEAPEELRKQMVVLTDSGTIGKRMTQEGIVYFGCYRMGQTVMDQETAYSQQIAHEAVYLQRPVQEAAFSQQAALPARKQVNPLQKTFFEHTSEKKPARDDETGWFDGAALVLEGFEEVDAKYLEEWMMRAQGLPAEIARTESLVLREMTEVDLPDLVRISRQGGGMGVDLELGAGAAISDQRMTVVETDAFKVNLEEDVFSEDRLRAYIHNAYRMQGFGLWSVLYQERVIGCCGFAPYESLRVYTHRMILNRTDEDPIDEGHIDKGRMDEDQSLAIQKQMREQQGDKQNQGKTDLREILEMQYMLDEAYHLQGFGTEMCRAALAYASERLDVDEVRLRIDEKNCASLALAEKLGFYKL